MNSLVNIIILWFIIGVNCQMGRYGHTATLIDKKLYILGGNSNGKFNDTGKHFFYLDVSASFNTQELLWHNLSNINTVPSHDFAVSVKGGPKNNTLFLYGATKGYELATYMFTPQSNIWGVPITLFSTNHFTRQYSTSTIDYNGKMYLWGGQPSILFSNEIYILDTINLIWGSGNLVGAPAPRVDCRTVFLPNNKIVYIGGSNSSNYNFQLDQVYLYDTIQDNWSVQNTSGDIPTTRIGFSSILGLDGQRIIIFGGNKIDSTDALYVLNTTNFEWYVPKISGKLPESRYFHMANVIEKYMVVSFGISNVNSKLIDGEDAILLLDISNNDEYQWTTSFEVLPPPPTSSPPPPNNTNNTSPIIVAAVIGSLIGSLSIAVGCFLLYKSKQKRSVMLISGNENITSDRQPVTNGNLGQR
ncbi:galactose oxidase [Rhizophagus irregularis]|uniref:Galactose oxidase n=1 Tax=Rhizophagus irregularis TaxID=588596 RepID=A0A2I1EAV3_9GLOM|nr:galactose oxidase [Rhizophagus irregularis]PKC67425.1 galactose oxidase [Rhizophagus irregularis]PKY19249.1 galactose oxidase [Rhizophagus irregularis]